MTPRGLPAQAPGPGHGAGPGPAAWIVLVVIFVGVLAWSVEEPSPEARLLIENPTTEPRALDVVWRASGSGVLGSFLRVLEPSGRLTHTVPEGSEACVRWIDPVRATVEVERRVPRVTGDMVILPPPAPTGSSTALRSCPPELAAQPIRPRLGRRILEGEPHRTLRERMIPRVLHRRQARRRTFRRRDGAGSVLRWLTPRTGPKAEARRTYWHLTPQGWIRGGWRTREQAQADRPPRDRVMSCVYEEGRPTNFVPATGRLSTVWTGSPSAARRLQSRFGSRPPVHAGPGRPGRAL